MMRARSGRAAAIVSGCLALAVASFRGASVPDLVSPGLRPVACEGGDVLGRWSRLGYIQHTLHEDGLLSTYRYGMAPGERSQRSLQCIEDADVLLDALRAALALVPDGPPPYGPSASIRVMPAPERRVGCNGEGEGAGEAACARLDELEARMFASRAGELWQVLREERADDGTRNGVRYVRGVGAFMRGPTVEVAFAATVTETGARCVLVDDGVDVAIPMTTGPTTQAWIADVARRAARFGSPEQPAERGAAAFELTVLRDWETVYRGPIGRTLAAEIEASLAASGCGATDPGLLAQVRGSRR